MTTQTLNLTIGTRYRIDGLPDHGTGLTNYTRWTFHGRINGHYAFSGSTTGQTWVRDDQLVRVARQHLAVTP